MPLEMDLIPLYNADLEARGDPKSAERLRQATLRPMPCLLLRRSTIEAFRASLKNANDADQVESVVESVVESLQVVRFPSKKNGRLPDG